MTDHSPTLYSLSTRPCLIEVGRFRWDIYRNDSLFQTSAESFDTEEEARAGGQTELERLVSDRTGAGFSPSAL
jgi:hypothetical protein